jgi:protein TonB
VKEDKMKKILFAEMIGKQKPTKKWLFLPISFIFHAFIVTALVVAPLLNADRNLPPVKTFEVMIVAPQTLSMPVGRGDATRTRGKISQKPGGNKNRIRKPVQPTVLTEPVEIPDEIVEEKFIDFGTIPGDGDSLVDGAPGDPNGVIGALLPGRNFKKDTPAKRIRVEQIPKLIKKVPPAYPEIALRSRVKGIVIIEAETDIYGRVIRTKVVTGNPLLDQAALEAVRKWVYEPYIINGFPRPVRFIVTLEFILKRR